MNNRNYTIEWNAMGMDFNYNGSIAIWAADESSAKEKAIQAVSRKMVMDRKLITIKSVKVTY
ncbi:hypothetical protein [Siminovitchia fordii]|uniref:Uncharacterized protein n=1 Tax=Siminovitchia fordii TaxID=254759 RepID=A0ABQ4KA76_9BACI|nr:hypothetical protein [Siminovitchia fordii]GIN22629.1 hypothetical protein J1TS3_37630 [Siminovitchia fordii]